MFSWSPWYAKLYPNFIQFEPERTQGSLWHLRARMCPYYTLLEKGCPTPKLWHLWCVSIQLLVSGDIAGAKLLGIISFNMKYANWILCVYFQTIWGEIMNIGQNEIPSDLEIRTLGHWTKRNQSGWNFTCRKGGGIYAGDCTPDSSYICLLGLQSGDCWSILLMSSCCR